MKRILSLITILLISAGCADYTTQDDIIKIIDEEMPETAYGIKKENNIEARTYFTGACYYTFYKNNKEVVGFEGKSNQQCVNKAKKVIISDAFLTSEEIKEVEKEKIMEHGFIVNNYFINISDKEALILKRRIPTTTSEVISYFEALGLKPAKTNEIEENSIPENLNSNYYYNSIQFSDEKSVQAKTTTYKDKDKLEESNIISDSLATNLDNSIEVFRNEEQVDLRYNELKKTLDSKYKADDYLIKKGKFLLVLSPDLLKEQATKYKEAFNSIFKELV